MSAIADSANSYSDGRWTSVHSYTGQLVHPDGRLFRFGGSRNSDGSNVNSLWSFQPALAASPGLAYRDHGNGGLSVNVFGAIAVYAPRYGKILAPGTTANLDFWMSAKTLVDLEGRYAVTKKLSLAVGADNLFDQYPDADPANLNTTGNAPYSNYSPFGRSGRYVYARLNYSL